MPTKKTTAKKPSTKRLSTNGHRKKPAVTTQVGNRSFTGNELDQQILLNHILRDRTGFLKDYLHLKRDTEAELGYPNLSELKVELFKHFYDREPIATRTVQVLPEESWSVVPEVFETEDSEETTPFEVAWKELSLSLLGESKYRRKEGSPIWEYLKRADVLSGIGFFGIIFLGLEGGGDERQDLEMPAEPREGQKLLFMRAFDQTSIQVSSEETDINSPRFGLPMIYSIEFSAPSGGDDGTSTNTVTKRVHWSRVIHLADNNGSNEVFGVPRMRPVFNRLWDLRKLYGGSAEMYWKGAFPGLALETHPSLGANATIDTKVMRENMENYMEGLQRYIGLSGMSARSLSPQVVDPSPQINTQLESICVQLAIPKRIFTGSERGELASSQDMNTWNRRLATRQNTYITPRIIVPFIDRLILLGVLPDPTEYHVMWPDLESQTDKERATIAVQNTEALAKYVAGDVETVMTPIDFFVRVLSMTTEEATAILEAAAETFDESEEARLKAEKDLAKETIGAEEDGFAGEED